MQILVVSSVTPVRQALRVLLEQEGHKVLIAESLKVGLERLSQNLILDAVISEWKLAPGNAFELRRRSQQIDRVTDSGVGAPAPTFIVLVTPDPTAGPSDLQQCDEVRAMGFDFVLPKPIDRHALRQCLADIARDRQPPAAPAAANPGAAAAQDSQTILELPTSAKVSTGDPSQPGKPRIADGEFRKLATEIHSLTEGLAALQGRLQTILQSVQSLAVDPAARDACPENPVASPRVAAG